MVPGVHDTVGLTDEFFRAVAADFSKFGIYEGNFSPCIRNRNNRLQI